MSEPRFPFLLLDVTPENTDELSATLFELGAEGVEERDDSTLVKARQPGGITLVASFPERTLVERALGELRNFCEESAFAAMSPSVEEIVGDGWRDAWKAHFRPFQLCAGLVVRPPWETYKAKPGESVLELEPGRAFGTGLHETTSLVATALSEHAVELMGKAVLDVGTGSGILALVALVFGAARTVAVDNDADVIGVVQENAARNGFSERVTAGTQTLAELTECFPFVVANIEARVLIPMAHSLMAKVAPGGILVLSGILAPQEHEVREAYREFSALPTQSKGEWVAMVLRAPASPTP
jgi:ribosomal protein L11 methyltransferase